MSVKFSIATVLTFGLLCGNIGTSQNKPVQVTKSSPAPAIDRRSYRLGEIEAFSEMVGKGVKTLAISDVLTTDETNDLINDAHSIAEKYGVQNYLEPDFLVTDLFAESITRGKTVILIYKSPDTLAAYRRLKADKSGLVNEGHYQGEARVEIARRFGQLLSYPDQTINDLLRSPQREP
jgi:hypothetical protein